MKKIYINDFNVVIPESSEQEKMIERCLQGTSFESLYHDVYINLYKIYHSEAGILFGMGLPRMKKRAEEYLNIAQSLMMCKFEDVILQGNQYKVMLSNEVKDIIGEDLEQKYIGCNLNLRPMTYEEGETVLSLVLKFPFREIYENSLLNYALSWILRRRHISQPEYVRSGMQGVPTDEEIKDFIEFEQMPVDVIDKKQISGTINRLEEEISSIKQRQRKGAPIKNEKLILSAIYFRRIGFTTKSVDLRIAYECLDIMQLVDKTRQTTGIKWLQSIFKASHGYKIDELPF